MSKAGATACEPGLRVVAVIVTFNPQLPTLLRLLDALTGQVGGGVIIDNGSSPQTQRRLAFESGKRGLSLLPLAKNLGIAAAHNRGIAWAAARGLEFILLLDQDSIPVSGMVAELVGAHDGLTGSGVRIAAVGPSYQTPAGGISPVFVRFGLIKFRRVRMPVGYKGWVAVDFLISSGCLIALKTLREVGGMEEELFIDHVDTEWFLRARQKGFRAFGVTGAVMEHTLGERCTRFWLGRWRQLPTHQPLRYYYIFRNSLLLYRRPYAPWQWIRNDLTRLLVMSFCFALLRSPRRLNGHFIIRGLCDGWRGRSGRFLETT